MWKRKYADGWLNHAKDYRKERYENRKKNHLCVSCGCELTTEYKYTLCVSCRQKNKDNCKKLYDEHKNKGLCVHCGRKKYTDKVYCKKCEGNIKRLLWQKRDPNTHAGIRVAKVDANGVITYYDTMIEAAFANNFEKPDSIRNQLNGKMAHDPMDWWGFKFYRVGKDGELLNAE